MAKIENETRFDLDKAFGYFSYIAPKLKFTYSHRASTTVYFHTYETFIIKWKILTGCASLIREDRVFT